MTEFIGFLAAILTTVSFVPQAVQILRTRETGGISLIMYVLFTAGIAAWLAYGIMIASVPVILANLVTIVLAGTILTLKARAVMAARRPARQPIVHGATAATSAPIA
ncbi:SemiSWEET transporter [Hyphomonas sp.]|uniref:SemiSWEET transporter n=1 Tax=Hyphomonas sp. TaxID=87 RepID=UPI0030F4D59D